MTSPTARLLFLLSALSGGCFVHRVLAAPPYLIAAAELASSFRASASDETGMARKKMITRACPNDTCGDHGAVGSGNVARHGYYRCKLGRRRRFRCKTCGMTFGTASGTPYHRLQSRRSRFDSVASMSVEGMSKSSISRVTGLAWSTVARWLERAAAAARRFNDVMMRGYAMKELQADELRAFLQSKRRETWVFTSMEVWSRLWPSCVVGRRSYRNAHALISDTVQRGEFEGVPLIATDGLKYSARVIVSIFGVACVYGQVIKMLRNNRVHRIDLCQVVGTAKRLEDALVESEDSTTLNTSFIERINLTIRQGSAYLGRRTLSHARCAQRLEDHPELLRCHDNFIRPHRALRFGRLKRTPAQQAGIASRRWSFRAVFLAGGSLGLSCVVTAYARVRIWWRGMESPGRLRAA